MPLSEESGFSILHSKVEAVKDESLIQLFVELESVRGVWVDGQQVIQLLNQAMYRPNGEQERRKFERAEVFDKPILAEKIGKLVGHGVYIMCAELVAKRQREIHKPDHIENHHGERVYIFLNSVFPSEPKRKSKRRY